MAPGSPRDPRNPGTHFILVSAGSGGPKWGPWPKVPVGSCEARVRFTLAAAYSVCLTDFMTGLPAGYLKPRLPAHPGACLLQRSRHLPWFYASSTTGLLVGSWELRLLLHPALDSSRGLRTVPWRLVAPNTRCSVGSLKLRPLAHPGTHWF